jgi:uncharacterized protein YbjQ (UPF0145 family)
MDSHIDTADPWAATTEAPEPDAQELHQPESAAGDDVVDVESAPAEVASKGGLFGRRKIRERSSSEDEEGFDLIAPAPHLLGEDPHFEVLESGILTEVPELGLGDKMGAAEEVPFEPSLSMVKPLDEKALRADDIFDFETMNEEIANAVADAQPAGIFGALANPGAHFSPPEADVGEEAAEDIVEEAEDIVEASNEATAEEFFEDTNASVDEVVHLSDEPLDKHADESEASGELDHGDEAGESDDELEEEAAVTTSSDSEESPSSDEQEAEATTAEHEDEPIGFEDFSEVDGTVDETDIPADPFEDTPTEMLDDSYEVDEIVEQSDIEEASMNLLTTTDESGFSLTNAPAEPIDGEEELFVSTGTEETIQDIVLVTTDTVPGMEMGDSCGLVTAVQAADEAPSLPSAIEKAHADLGAKAEEAGATAVISVTTSINEVQAGFLVIASGTAVVAAS